MRNGVDDADAITQRLFVVGYPRSGTTLLQALMSTHGRITSFPEAHFFPLLYSAHSGFARTWLPSPKALPRLKAFLREVGRSDLNHMLPPRLAPKSVYVARFISLLDRLALDASRDVWLEKTPGNLHHIPAIQRAVPSAQFLHILRNGEDAIASLYEVTQAHPRAWSGARSIKTCTQRWIRDVSISLGYRNQPGHIFVSYDELVMQPTAELISIAAELGLRADDFNISATASNARYLVNKDEPWKEQNLKYDGPRAPDSRKFDTVLSHVQREVVRLALQQSGIPANLLAPGRLAAHR